MIRINNNFIWHQYFNPKRLYSVKKTINTIYALCSGQGKCGVSVIRVSGPQTIEAVTKLADFHNTIDIRPRHAYLKKIHHPKTGEFIDKGLLLWFPGPNSFTGEDSCEFQIHGGPAVVAALLNSLGSLNGFRQATAGEFTKRAFYSGKLDLTEVEGLADLIHAETELQRQQAVLQANGILSKQYNRWTKDLLKNVAHIEAFIDFGEDQHIDRTILLELCNNITKLKFTIERHLNDGRRGEILRHGVKSVILGAPNVGKSSFLNRICGRSVSIVTNISGTTRDIIETAYNISGYPVLFADTAGLRKKTTDIIEAEGIAKARDFIATADLCIIIVDAVEILKYNCNFPSYHEKYLAELELSIDFLQTKNTLTLINKCDLVSDDIQEKIKLSIKKSYCGENIEFMSCVADESGFESVIQRITKILKKICGEPSAECPNLSQQRHRELLRNCLESLDEFLILIENQFNNGEFDLAIAAQQLKNSMRHLSGITGRISSTEDILDVIFKDFCIGK